MSMHLVLEGTLFHVTRVASCAETTLFKTVIAQMFEEMSNKRCLNLYKAVSCWQRLV